MRNTVIFAVSFAILSVFQAFGTDNIAPLAKATASSCAEGYSASAINDADGSYPDRTTGGKVVGKNVVNPDFKVRRVPLGSDGPDHLRTVQ